MPKISRAGGASSAAAVPEPATGGVVEDPPVVGEGGPAREVLPERGHQVEAPTEDVEVPTPAGDDREGERPSVGSSSETSPEKPLSSPVTSETAPPKRARTTGSRSSKGRAGSSTAASTATSGEADGT